MTAATSTVADALPSANETSNASRGTFPGFAKLRAFLSRRGVLAVVDQGIVSAANFITSVVIGRLCGETDLGVYFLGISVFYFVRGMQEQILAGPYTVYSQRRSPEALPAYAGSILIHQAIFACLTMGGLAVAETVLKLGYGPQQFLRVVPILTATLPLLLLRDLLRQMTYATLSVRPALLLDILASMLQVLTFAALAACHSLNVVTVFAAMGAACGAAAVAWFITTGASVRVHWGEVGRDFRENWNFGRWALASQLIGCSLPYVMPWIVATTEGEEAAGLLGASGTLVGIANMFVIGFCRYLSPRAARAWIDGGAAELTHVLRNAALLFIALLGPFAVGTALVGNAALRLVYGHALDGGGLILFLLTLNVLANSLGMVAGNGLWAVDRPALNFSADAAAFVITLTATALLVPGHGVMGTVVATLAGTTASAVVRATSLVRCMRSNPP